MFRFISVLQRKRRFSKDEKKTLVLFNRYIRTIQTLPAYHKRGKKILLIRLDDIGDYLLFRNTLSNYKQSEQWKEYSVTLLGNAAWKELFEVFDAGTTNTIIWINKKEYLSDDSYRYNLWLQLRKEGYEVVICPSATRPILLDDLCRLATGAETAIGFSNFTPHKQWKVVSDELYTSVFQPASITYEFFLNLQFSNWCCNGNLTLKRPFISGYQQKNADYIVCFIGASTKSKRWPVRRWRQLIEHIKKEYSCSIKVIGVREDEKNAVILAGNTNTESITGTSLTDMITIMKDAGAVITNDTMTAHLGVSCGLPVVIVANGGSLFIRFTDYANAGIKGVKTVYPKIFLKKRKQQGEAALQHHIASTSDIASIRADIVFSALKEVW